MTRWVLLLALVAAACGSDPERDRCLEAPTYTNAIRPQIIEPKCLMCHSVDKTGADRMGAPDGIDFDTYEIAKPRFEDLSSAITSGCELLPMLMSLILVSEGECEFVCKW